ncbi:MFS transporter [Cohnella xylanilytica]|uniref:MFS transporter n=1 Tax=Cohnella xylanilytica TaxID=557555 RepID=A0A841TT23_9BACL|nr:MFS transporter [Cohnella xylanilytica]MBB6691607.1 MFS transporter [Cohnella xylanilytica]
MGTIKPFNFFVYGAMAVFSAYFPIYLQSVGLSAIEIGALLAGGPFISIVANPLWGYWSDRTRNVRRMLIWMLIGNLLVMQLAFATRDYAWIYGSMLAFFFFQMPLFSQVNSLILNAIEGTDRKFGSFRLWGSLGWALVAVGAGPVVGAIGIGNLRIVYSVMLAVAIAFAFGLPAGEPKEGGRESARPSYRKAFASRPFLLLIVLGVLVSVPNSMNNTFVPIFISDLGGGTSLIGLSAFLSSIFEIPAFLLLDKYLPRGKGKMALGLAAVSLLFALRWLLMAFASAPYHVILIQALHCVTFGGYYYIGTQLTSRLVPAEYRASGQAAYALTWGGLSGVIAGAAGGWLFQQAGPRAMYGLGAALALAGCAGFVALSARLRGTSSPSEDRLS